MFIHCKRIHFSSKKEMGSSYLQQLVREVGLNQPVVQCNVEELVLGPLGQTKDLFKLDADTPSIKNHCRRGDKLCPPFLDGRHLHEPWPPRC